MSLPSKVAICKDCSMPSIGCHRCPACHARHVASGPVDALRSPRGSSPPWYGLIARFLTVELLTSVGMLLILVGILLILVGMCCL